MHPGGHKQATGCHIVAMPYPGRGHINPMINLCTHLASRDSITITIVLTEEWLGLVGWDLERPNIRLRSIPNVVPSEHDRAADMIGFIESVFTKMEAPFCRLLDQLDDLPVSCVLADTLLPWITAVGSRRSIPTVSLWTAVPSTFLGLYEEFPETREEIIVDPPEVSSMNTAGLPSVEFKDTRTRNLLLEAFSCATKSQGIVFTSFYELQPHVISSLRAKLHVPIHAIGPSIPYMSLNVPPSMPLPSSHEDCFSWLDSQAEASVLYVSMGSFYSTSSEQLHELSKGLDASGYRYLWVARKEAIGLQESSGVNGLVVPWCDQLRVLCHSSVGGFLTHCGWNSTMESIYAGVPMLTFPLAAEQPYNSTLIVDDWKIGLELKSNVEADNLVGGEEISHKIMRLMDPNGEEAKDLRKRAQELQETCRRAVEQGGSTDCNIVSFVDDIIYGKLGQRCNGNEL
ncbi:hypothetical protein RJ639_013756 [Escallonia herrerae]|uniref:Glycosyltransferase n=1 Tax=Escallonia herrerae TaxID=1293975 RepID=A0AA89AP25_9ASTE|nr:hypothetical protein RJ639_013756 [Escallonia herrerae]